MGHRPGGQSSPDNHLSCDVQAVRSTHGLEVPLSHGGKLLVGEEYVHFLTQKANQKMEENFRRIHRSVGCPIPELDSL